MTTTTSSRVLEHPARDQIRLEDVLHALADAVRLRIVRDMAREDTELSCSYFDLPVTKSTTTHHFRVLRESGVVRQVYRGRRSSTSCAGRTSTPSSPASSTPSSRRRRPRPAATGTEAGAGTAMVARRPDGCRREAPVPTASASG